MRRMLLCILGLVFCSGFLTAQTNMTNDSVIKMAKAGLSESIIISSIDSHPGAYKTNPDDLIALKSAGVSDKVIAEMMAKDARAPQTANQSPKIHASASSDAPDSKDSGGTAVTNGIVEAEIGNGDLKPARFAKIFVLSAQKAVDVKSGIFTVAGSLKEARRDTEPNGPERSLVEIECLKGLIKLKLALVTSGINATSSLETSQDIVPIDADELGQFQLKGVNFNSYVVVAVGKVGMNGAIWVSETRTANQQDVIKLSQPVFSCYDEQAVF